MQNLPTLKFSYGNLLLSRLHELGPAAIGQLLGDDPAQLFKSEGKLESPGRRARDCLRFAQMLGLSIEEEREWALTESGANYASLVDKTNPWIVNDRQAEILRKGLSGDAPLAEDVRIALEVLGGLPGKSSNEDFGRALAEHTRSDQWQADRTFEAQGARYRELLIESGLVDKNGELTAYGLSHLRTEILGAQPSVWWVNQGTTYTKERDGGFLWAANLSRGGRPVHHWETMDEVREGDVVLHYSNSTLRAVSRVSAAARPAPNPLDSQAWETEGRLVQTQYHELNEPVPLSAIDEGARIRQSAPFTVSGSVQQVYLVRLQDDFVNELADRFPELAAFLPSVPAGNRASRSRETMPSELYSDFAAAVEKSGLHFSASSNLVQSFVSSLLAKPFAILTGLAGSGKTQLAMRLGEWFGTDEHGRHRHVVIPVRPDWTGPEAIFGYEDALRTSTSGSPVWFVPEAFEFVLRAEQDPEHPYLLILDEMNLAHVERYFSDFLSGVESRRPVLPDLVFDPQSNQWVLRALEAQKLPLPRNLFVIGTVNIDETTYMFSPKVLDRAFTFEFRVTTDDLDPDLRRPIAAPAASDQRVRAFASLAARDDWQLEHPHPAQDAIVSALRQAHAILANANQEFGHRTLYEILRFCAFLATTGDTDPDTALDLSMLQKVLPKVHGSRRRIEPVLNQLERLALGPGSTPRLPATHQKITRMLDSVRANQFVSFSE